MTQDERKETAMANHRWAMSKIRPCLDPHYCGHFCSGKCVSLDRQKEQTMRTDRDVPERWRNHHACIIDGEVDDAEMEKQLMEELGTAESLVRDLARKIDQMVIDADRVNGSTGYYVPKSELMCLLSHVPKELR